MPIIWYARSWAWSSACCATLPDASFLRARAVNIPILLPET